MRVETTGSRVTADAPPNQSALLPTPKKNVLWIIIGIVALNSVGMSIVLPLLPFIVGEYLPAQQVVIGMSTLLSVFAACTFIAAPALGALSDRYGRKPVLIVSVLGSVVGYVLFGVGGALWVLFLGRIIDGLTAGNISTLFAYVSDRTEPGERTKWFGYIGSAMSIGKLGGPALGGLLGSLSIALPFYVTAGLIFLSGLAVYLFLPESLAPEKRLSHVSLKTLNVFSHFSAVFSLKIVRLLLVVGILFYAGLSVFQVNFIVLLKDVYQWGPAVIGSLLTLVGVCDITVRAWLLPRLLAHFSEKRIGLAGLAILGTGLLLVVVSIALSSTAFVALALIGIIAGAGLFEPTYTSRLSRSVSEREQGKVQGVNQSLLAANNVLIPLGAAALYLMSPGVLYAAAAAVVLGAVLLYAKYIR